MRIVCLCLSALPAWALAQPAPSNLEAYQTLVVRCLAEVPDTARALVIDAPAVMPYLRTALSDTWRAEGRSVYLADSSFAAQRIPTLSFGVEEAAVEYARASRKTLGRTITLAVSHTFAAPSGLLLDDGRCRKSYEDLIPKRGRASLEAEAFSETQGRLPRAGWVRRYVEPAALAAVSAVTVFLFFNLRSDRFDDGG